MEESWKREEVKMEISLGKQCFSGSLNSRGGWRKEKSAVKFTVVPATIFAWLI